MAATRSSLSVPDAGNDFWGQASLIACRGTDKGDTFAVRLLTLTLTRYHFSNRITFGLLEGNDDGENPDPPQYSGNSCGEYPRYNYHQSS